MFGSFAVKRIKEGVNSYLVSRVERIESIKDGTEVLSFKVKENPPVRLRCALYIRVKDDNADDEYQVGEEILLTPWRSPCGVLGPVELLPVAESPGRYVMHEESKKWLKELGYVPFAEEMDSPEDSEEISPQDQELEEGFYEAEEVLGRRLRRDMTYEFQVRFKGYGPEDDMWLPASSFNRAVSFQTTSRFGRKRKHKTSEDGSVKLSEPPTKKAPKSSQEKKQEKQGTKLNKDDGGKKVAKKAEKDVKQPKSKRKPSRPKRSSRECSSRKEKGKSFRSSLSSIQREYQATKKEYSSPKQHGDVISLASDDSDVSDTGNGDERDVEKSTLKDLCRRDNNFATPRRYLADAQLPLVDPNIQIYRIKRVKDELDATPRDPLTVDRVPPISVVTESMDALFKTKTQKEMRELNSSSSTLLMAVSS